MKKMMMMILALGFVGTSAMAFEGAFVPTLDGGAEVQVLKGRPTCPVTPVPNGNYCQPTGKSCSAGYDQFAKLCWGGWTKGFYKCGITCKPKEQCGWNPRGDWTCGHRGHNYSATIPTVSAISGLMEMTSTGDVKITAAKKTCEDLKPGQAWEGQTCTPADGNTCYAPYKRMAKYCFGGWKHPLYKCGIVCSVPRQPTQN